MKMDTLTIVGVGLIGGSIGLGVKRRGLARRVRGVGRSRANLERAVAVGAIDEAEGDLTSAVRDADVVVFCTPVDRIAEQVLAVAPHCAAGTLLTDAGSTKAEIVRRLDGRLQGPAFIGSHPLAGSEKRGVEHADPNLFETRVTVITPTRGSERAAVERTRAFWEALGSRVLEMEPEAHDRALALTSHVPHLVAVALAGTLPPELCDLTASGFRDTTRVAGGEPEIWTAIFQANRDAVLDALRPFCARLDDLRRALETRDYAAVDALLTQAMKVRHALGS